MFQLKNISKSFSLEGQTIRVLDDISFAIKPGEVVGLMGASGAGKSTLLHIAGLLESPSKGHVHMAGLNVENLSDTKKTQLRSHKIGFIYQSHRLLADFTALENVMLPQLIAGVDKPQALVRATALLDQVGLSHRHHHRPTKLSGGEQQRVAMARALANKPALLLADEPTGNLDSRTAEDIFALLLTLVKKQNMAALIATHNPDLGNKMDRIIHLKDGYLVE
jgi:lipoprotein-releasing system ATP-binding protein